MSASIKLNPFFEADGEDGDYIAGLEHEESQYEVRVCLDPDLVEPVVFARAQIMVLLDFDGSIKVHAHGVNCGSPSVQMPETSLLSLIQTALSPTEGYWDGFTRKRLTAIRQQLTDGIELVDRAIKMLRRR